MASHPYISGSGNIAQMIGFLRKNFPASVNSETVKKFGLASNNESYVINALQFIGVIDEEGNRTENGHTVFVLGDDDFPSAFSILVRDAYSDLFELRGDDAWTLPKKELISYFRTTDKTSEIIGGRQAQVFSMFRELAGQEPVSDSSSPKNAKKMPSKKSKPAPAKETKTDQKLNANEKTKDMTLTVRIEINLPADGTQETYDAIFRSIKANLINE